MPPTRAALDAALVALEDLLQHRFHDQRLIRHALTHRSWLNEHPQEQDAEDFERLEFLGDAAVGLLVAERLYVHNPDLAEGALTRQRAAVVNEAALSRIATEMGIPAALRLGHGEDLSGGRRKSSILADSLEAVLGALLIDVGYAGMKQLVEPLFERSLGRVDESWDDKSALQAKVQEGGAAPPRYRIVGASGPEHQRQFEVAIVIDGQEVARGAGPSKKQASQVAAAIALSHLALNRAGVEALRALPGISASLALAIVQERAANGPFVALEDLTRVKGVGPVCVAKLRPLVQVWLGAR